MTNFKKWFQLTTMLAMALTLFVFTACDDDDDDNDLGLATECDIPNKIKNDYDNDAAYLALRLQQAGGPAANDVQISPVLIDRMEAALAAVYKSDFSARDSVFQVFEIHTRETPEFENITVEVDTSYAWVQEWANGNRLTGNSEVDALMNIYGLDLDDFTSLSLGSIAKLDAQNPLNMVRLGELFSEIDGVVAVDTNDNAPDGNDITVEDFGSSIQITFSVGYDNPNIANDCTGDCDFRRNYIFNVADEDCNASFVNATGDAAPEAP